MHTLLYHKVPGLGIPILNVLDNNLIIRGGNPKRTIVKIDKNELDSNGKNMDTSIGVVRIDQNY